MVARLAARPPIPISFRSVRFQTCSVSFYPRRLDDRRPARELGLHPFAELFGSARRRGDALLQESLLGLRRAQDLADLAVELGYDAGRGLRRREEAEPQPHVHARNARFDGARDLGRARETLGARHRERLDLAGLELRVRGERREERHLYLAREHGGERVARALIGNVLQWNAGDALQQLAGEMAGRAVSRRGVGKIALLL